MIEIIIISIISILLIAESIVFIIFINRSDEKIATEQKSQLETKNRIQTLYEFLNSLKNSSVYVEDPLVSEIYKNCLGLLDYFDYVYYKKDQEKLIKIDNLVKQIQELTGKNVILTKENPALIQQNKNVENMGTLKKY